MDLKELLKKFYDAGIMAEATLEEKYSFEKTLADNTEALQLQQTGVNGSFFKCTCLRPQTNCFSGKCSYCNKTIQKDITTDDL